MGKFVNTKHGRNEFKGPAGFMLLVSVLLQLLLSSFPISLPIYWTEITSYYDLSGDYVASLGVLCVAMSLPAPLVSVWLKRYGPSMCFLLCFIGGILTPLGFIVSAFSPNYSLLYFSFAVISGVGYMLVTLAAEIIPQLWFSESRYLATGISRSSLVLGYFIWTPIIKSAVDAYAWRGAALVQGGLLLNILAIAQILSNAPDSNTKRKYSVTKKPSTKKLPSNTNQRQILRLSAYASHSSQRNIPKTLKESGSSRNGTATVPNVRFGSSPTKTTRPTNPCYFHTGCRSISVIYDTMLLIGCTLVLVGYYSNVAMLVSRAESFGIKQSQVTVLLPLYAAVGVVSRLVFGYVGDQWFVNGVVLCGIGAALSGLFCMMSDAMTRFPEQCIFVIILSISHGMYDATWPAVFVNIYGTKWKEFAVSVFVFCSSLGKILSYFITDWLVSETQDPNTPYIVFGAFHIIAGGILAAIAFIQKFLSQLRVTNVKDHSEDSTEDEGAALLKRPLSPHLRVSRQEEQWRDRTSSNVSQLKEFYPI